MIYNVIVPFDLDKSFGYSLEDEGLSPGQLVIVNFRGRETVGIIKDKDSNYQGPTKTIKAVLPYKLNSIYLKFVEFVAAYNLNSIGNVFRLLVPLSVNKILTEEKQIKSIKSSKDVVIVLNAQQREVLEALLKLRQGFQPILLQGVTGSGKTEVFLEFVKGMQQVLILVPEVALSSELAKKVANRLDTSVFIWHSSISSAKKRDIWKKAVNGDHMVIVGARSALFIPFKKLEAIIIDEEHDSSFKQTEGPTYNARDMGIYLASLKKIPIILSSATPSLETYHNALIGRYKYLKLTQKFVQMAAPEILIEDLRKTKTIGSLSALSLNAIHQCLAEKQQVLVFANRRGHTPKVLCQSCGWKAQCPNCDTWLCYHAKENLLRCHYCNFCVHPYTKCKSCGEDSLIGLGSGVEKIADEIQNLFKEARILSLSSDNMNSPLKIEKTLGQIQRGEVDIIVGTQILAKGHNFPHLNTVIISCLDSLLYGNDFRTSERAFQTLHQVVGRAGRFREAGQAMVIFQTFNPDDSLTKLIAENNLEAFYRLEEENRKNAQLPPFAKMASFELSSVSESALLSFCKDLIKTAPRHPNFQILGPLIPEPPKINKTYRMRIVIIGSRGLQGFLRQWLLKTKAPRLIRLNVDIDPLDLF